MKVGMEYFANDGKKVDVVVGNVTYLRHAIKTNFAEIGDSYAGMIEKYVVPQFQPGDLLFSASKILSICSKNVINPSTMKVSKLATFLSSKVDRTSAGMGLSLPLKMQYALNTAGVPRIFLAAGIGQIGKKLFHKKGWFYTIAGRKVAGIDGFGDAGQSENNLIGIPLPDNAQQTCDETYAHFGIPLVITDTNDLATVTLAASKIVRQTYSKKDLEDFVRDNPYGQGMQCTPFVLVRKATT